MNEKYPIDIHLINIPREIHFFKDVVKNILIHRSH